MTRSANDSGLAALERGRQAYAARSWRDAYESLSAADEREPLGPDDLELLATTAHMLGRDDEFVSILERAHNAYMDAGESLRGVRSAFWIGMNLAFRREMGPASGWLGRAQRILDREEADSVERGYMLMPLMFQHEAAGDFEAAAAVAAEAAAIAERFGDADAFAMTVHGQGYMLIKAGRVKDGLALLDEAMVGVTGGKLSPLVTGIVYCGVILACQEVFEVRRAKEWTAALSQWCEQQPDLVAFTGRCLVHRAEIMQLLGSWSQALEESRLAGERFAKQMNPNVGLAHYRAGEIQRLQGDFDAAEASYRAASGFGWEPQPGLAQLRLAQGRSDAAVAAIKRIEGETTEPLKRATLLPAYVEIMLAVEATEEARTACVELEELADTYSSAMLRALAAHARGSVALAEGDAQAALVALRRARAEWNELEAPHEVARARTLLGLACRALGDADAADLELEAARVSFEELGARPDVAFVRSLTDEVEAGDVHGLTARELEVLRFLASGSSNKEIASTLVISEHTVARHVQNIFAKLDVSSRAAAGAFAFEHDLV
jgi:DNA-binding CsgD family transcriptional regulator